MFPCMPVSAKGSLAALSVLSPPWLSPQQAASGDTFRGPSSPRTDHSSKRDAVIKQRDGDKVWSGD